MRRALSLLVLGLACLGAAQMQQKADTVLTSTRALILAPPMMVAGQNVVDISASADGRYLLAMRSVPSPVPLSLERPPQGPLRKEILIWDSVNGESKTLQMPTDLQDGFIVEWFPGSAKAVLSVMFPFYSDQERPNGGKWAMGYGVRAWILDAASGRLQLLSEDKEPFVRAWSVSVSPTRPFGVILTDEAANPPFVTKHAVSDGRVLVEPPQTPPAQKPITLRMVSADGRQGVEVKLPLEYVAAGANGWSADGSEFLVELRKLDLENRRGTPVILHFDPTTGAFYDTIGAIAGYQAELSIQSVQLERRQSEVGTGTEARPVVSWWLRSNEDSKDMDALVVEHSDNAIVAPGEKFVAYAVDGALFVRTIVELDAATYAEMLAAAERAVLISNAKQIGLAAMMYAGDYDDELPAGLSKQDLLPYVKNERLFEGFVFVFPGGKLTAIENPTETVMGYIEGPGGRAVVYMDSHVKWIPTGGG